MKTKNFYKQVNFYLTIFSLGLVIAAFLLYLLNCPSEFNGGVVSREVVTGHIVAIIFILIAVVASIAEFYLKEKPVISEIIKYRRFCLYIAFIALIYSFFMSILAEYSLIGTILYPIVSGTIGDPVEPLLANSYFSQLINTLIAMVFIITSALILKKGYYKAEKAAEGNK